MFHRAHWQISRSEMSKRGKFPREFLCKGSQCLFPVIILNHSSSLCAEPKDENEMSEPTYLPLQILSINKIHSFKINKGMLENKDCHNRCFENSLKDSKKWAERGHCWRAAAGEGLSGKHSQVRDAAFQIQRHEAPSLLGGHIGAHFTDNNAEGWVNILNVPRFSNQNFHFQRVFLEKYIYVCPKNTKIFITVVMAL